MFMFTDPNGVFRELPSYTLSLSDDFSGGVHPAFGKSDIAHAATAAIKPSSGFHEHAGAARAHGEAASAFRMAGDKAHAEGDVATGERMHKFAAMHDSFHQGHSLQAQLKAPKEFGE